MGGADKALLSLAGRSLIAHVAQRLAPQVDCLAISANGDAGRFADLACAVLPDAAGHLGEGPLAGVLAGLAWAEAQGADLLVTASCDTPFLPVDLVARLVAAGAPAMASSQGRQHPTAALWPVSLRGALEVHFAAGERRMRVALAGAKEVAFDVLPDPFANINTPADLAEAEARLGT